MPASNVNVDAARAFLDALDPEGIFTFQTFNDKKDSPRRSSLNRVLHGSFDEHADALRELNDGGAGIFVMVNAGDGEVHEGQATCRTNRNVVSVRALFVDLDGAPLDPVLKNGPTPSIVIESSPERWHVYWRVSGCPLNAFKQHQQALADKFRGDKSINDLARVMRLPGFLHRKAEPFLTRIVTTAQQEKAR